MLEHHQAVGTFDEREALRYPLFQDDFGAPGDKVLSDQIITARKAAECHECLEAIDPGTRYRKHVGVYDGQLMAFKFCAGCCAAMAKVFNGNHLAMEARWAIRAAAFPSPAPKDLGR